MNRRPYQVDALRAFRAGQVRLFCLLWERQSGKSTTLADMSLEEMVRRTGHACVYASASLLLSRELVLKQSQRVGLCGREVAEQEAAAAPTGRAVGNWEEGQFFDQFRVVSTNFDQFRPKNI